MLAEENIETYLPIPTRLLGRGKFFILKATGDSMINAGIYYGDKIVLKQQSSADNGDIVAALVEDSATIKRFYKENGHYRLQPENDTMSPIIVDDVKIIGKVVGLVRKF